MFQEGRGVRGDKKVAWGRGGGGGAGRLAGGQRTGGSEGA